MPDAGLRQNLPVPDQLQDWARGAALLDSLRQTSLLDEEESGDGI